LVDKTFQPSVLAYLPKSHVEIMIGFLLIFWVDFLKLMAERDDPAKIVFRKNDLRRIENELIFNLL